MIDADILKLSEQPSRPLDRLEADIWVGVDARIETRRVSRAVFSCQAAVLAISISVGATATMANSQTAGLDVFSTHADLAPSTRLIGH